MVKKNFKGTALVTGAAKRIGKAIASFLAAEGYQIAAHYNHSEKDAQAVVKDIRKKGVACELFQCDLGSQEDTALLVQRVHAKFPDLNLLINSASIFEKSKFKIRDLDLFNDHFAINLKAPFILSSEFRKFCKRGQIINLLDTDIVKNQTTHIAYLLTKKSLADMTKLAAIEFAPHIRVNGIAPGLILPPAGKPTAYLDQRAKRIPLQRKGDVHYITQSVKFLLDHDFLTGQIIFNDGGEHLVP